MNLQGPPNPSKPKALESGQDEQTQGLDFGIKFLNSTPSRITLHFFLVVVFSTAMKSVSAPHTRLLAQKMSADVRHTGLWKRDLANSNITALLQSLHFFAFFATDSECREHGSSLSEFLPTKTQNFIINSLDAEVCGVKAQSIARECLDPSAHEGNLEILMFLQLYRLSASRFCNFIRCWCVHESSWTVGQMNSPALDFGRSLQRRGEICMES